MSPMVEEKRQRRRRRSFSDEFKAGAVRLVLDEGKSINQVAKEIDLTASTMGNWVARGAGRLVEGQDRAHHGRAGRPRANETSAEEDVGLASLQSARGTAGHRPRRSNRMPPQVRRHRPKARNEEAVDRSDSATVDSDVVQYLFSRAKKSWFPAFHRFPSDCHRRGSKWTRVKLPVCVSAYPA